MKLFIKSSGTRLNQRLNWFIMVVHYLEYFILFSTYRMECESFVRFKVTEDGEYLTVKVMNLQHNHPTNVVSSIHITLVKGLICIKS